MSGEITAADVREALLRLAGDDEWCRDVARHCYPTETIGMAVMGFAADAAAERATCAAEARAEGDR